MAVEEAKAAASEAADTVKGGARRAGGWLVDRFLKPSGLVKTLGIASAIIMTGGAFTAMAGGASFWSAAGNTIASNAGLFWDRSGTLLSGGYELVTQGNWSEAFNKIGEATTALTGAPTEIVSSTVDASAFATSGSTFAPAADICTQAAKANTFVPGCPAPI